MHVGFHAPIDPVRPEVAASQPVREPDEGVETNPGEATSVAISDEARAVAGADASGETSEEEREGAGESEGEARTDENKPPGEGELSAEEKEQVAELQARDREVRAHEQAHAAVAGALGGAPSYEFATGPDGKRYAVGGEVSIKVGKGRTPEETLQKAAQIRAAALAPAEPSGQDQSVAARAQALATEARAELAEERTAELAEPEAAVPSEEPAEAEAEGEVGEAPPPPKKSEPPPEPKFRAGGVGGGHVHMSLKCPTCTAGIAKYQG